MGATAVLLTAISGACVIVITVEGICPRLALAVGAAIADRADVTVATLPLLRCEDTAAIRFATAAHAGVGASAGKGFSGYALPFSTLVAYRAEVVVIAWGRIVGVDAACSGVALVISANVLVAAVDRYTRLAREVSALVISRAFVPIIAATAVGLMLAASERMTGVVAARVLIIAIDHDFAHALT